MNKIDIIMACLMFLAGLGLYYSNGNPECKAIEKRAIEFLDEEVANGNYCYTHQDIEIIIFGEIQE